VPRRREPAFKARRSMSPSTQSKAEARYFALTRHRLDCPRLAVISTDRLCFGLRMKSLWFKAIPLLTCLFLAAGCNSALQLGNVLVNIVEYRPTAVDTEARLTLRFTNENIFPIAIANTSGKLYLNGTYVGQFEVKEAMGLPQLGIVNRDTVLRIENTAFMQQLRGTASTPSISYRLESVMRLEVSEERTKIHTDSTGQIDGAALRTEPASKH
jgi:LEA14-like dessication related protein